MGCNHGYFPGIDALENSLESSDAFCREDWSWYCHELRYLVGQSFVGFEDCSNRVEEQESLLFSERDMSSSSKHRIYLVWQLEIPKWQSLTEADEAYNSVIWSTADTAMTIVATSIPVLRVFFKQAVNTAVSNYYNSSRQSKSKSTTSRTTPSHPPNNAGSRAHDSSARRLNKNATSTLENTSTDSLVADVESGTREGHFELDDLVVDEKTGRVTARTPDFFPESMSCAHRHEQDWPLEDRSQAHAEGCSRSYGR
jgi:hypothetical protein